jgi:YggT family protein
MACWNSKACPDLQALPGADTKDSPNDGFPMRAILDLILLILQLYTWVIIISAVLSWMLAFNVLNYSNQFVRAVWNAVNALTEPLLRPIRRMMPNLGTVDISPVILLLAIFLLERIIVYYIYPAARGL